MSKSIASTSEPPSSSSKEAQKAETESVIENPAMTAICAFVNDRENRILGALVDRLGSLESGALLPLEEEPPELGGGRHYIIHLDTKYYTSQVHVSSWATLDAFTTALKLRPQMQVYALMVCAESEELNQQFLGKVAQFVGALETLEVKAMVIKIKEPPIFGQSDNGSKNKTADVVSDTDLSQFSFNRGIELIHVWEGKKPHSDADFRPEEEGAFGIGRVQEVLETVRWPGLQCKPNPIGRSEHRRRLNDYVNEMDEEEDAWEAATTLREAKTALADGDEDRDFRFLPPSLEAKMVGGGGVADFLPFVMSAATTSAAATSSARDGQGSSNNNNKDGTATDGEAKTGENAIAAAAGDDYPDTEDEEAILQWFDRPFSHQFQVNDFPSTFVGQPWPPHATTTAGGTAPLMATAPPLPPMLQQQQQQQTWQQPWREDMARKIKEAEEKRLAQASATSARARTTTSANVRGTTTAAATTTSVTTTTSAAITTSATTTTAAPTLAELRKRPTTTKSKQQQQQQKKREKSREADDAEECCGEDEEEEEEEHNFLPKELTGKLNLHPLKVVNMADAVGLDMLQLGQLMGGGSSSSSRRDGQTDRRKPREDQRQPEEGKEEKKTQPKSNVVSTASDRMSFPTMHTNSNTANSSSNSLAMEAEKKKAKGQPGNGGGKRTAAAGGKSHDE